MYKYKIKIWRKFNKEAFSKDIITKYENRENDYYTLIFFENPSEMYEWYDKKFGKSDPEVHNYSGLVKYIARNYYEDETFSKIIDYSKSCGYILLNLEEFTAEILCHETNHAIIWYFNYRIEEKEKIFNDTDYNELFCYISGNMSRLINNKYYEIMDKKNHS